MDTSIKKIDKGVEVNYHGPGTYIQIVGNWDGWKKPIDLEKVTERSYSTFLRVPNGIYQYQYIVDGNWKVLEKETNIVASDSGEYNHILSVGDFDYKQIVYFDWPEPANQVYLHIQPNWDKSFQLTKKEGIFYFVTKLPFGTYQYKFCVDGEWKYRTDLPIVQNEDQSINNVVEISPGKQITSLFFNDCLPDIPIRYFRYLMHIPKEYHESLLQGNQTKPWPLILFLHGSEACGNQPDQFKKSGIFKHLEDSSIPFIFASPICPNDYVFMDNFEILIELIYDIIEQYKIDRSKIYIVGMGSGARTTLKMIRKFSYLIAATALFDGNYQSVDFEFDKEDAEDVSPSWIFHLLGPGKESKDTLGHIKKFQKNQGEKVKLSVFESSKYTDVRENFMGNDLFEWLMKYSRTNFIKNNV